VQDAKRHITQHNAVQHSTVRHGTARHSKLQAHILLERMSEGHMRGLNLTAYMVRTGHHGTLHWTALYMRCGTCWVQLSLKGPHSASPVLGCVVGVAVVRPR